MKAATITAHSFYINW